MSARVYCLYRVSTAKQVDYDDSHQADIPMQRNACHAFAAKMGWKIIHEEQETGVSGYKVSADHRDKLQLIRDHAKQGNFDILLVFMFDRLGRRADETPFVVEWFVKNGIQVWSVNEGEQRFDSHTDRLTNYIRFWQADGESQKTSIRTRTAQGQMVEEGRFRGGSAPCAAEFHNRYPYSGKIICEEHGTSFHRQVLKSAKGEKEVWQCRVYRNRGRAACSAPQLRTAELDQIMAQIFNQLAQNKQAIVDAVVKVIQSVPDEHDYGRDALRVEEDLSAIHAKKDRLLEMSMGAVITIEEFKRRNDGFNEQIKSMEERLERLKAEEQKSKRSVEQLDKIKTALEEELSFANGVNSELVTTILDHIAVKKGSTRKEVHLDIHLKFGGPYGVVFDRENSSFRFSPS